MKKTGLVVWAMAGVLFGFGSNTWAGGVDISTKETIPKMSCYINSQEILPNHTTRIGTETIICQNGKPINVKYLGQKPQGVIVQRP